MVGPDEADRVGRSSLFDALSHPLWRWAGAPSTDRYPDPGSLAGSHRYHRPLQVRWRFPRTNRPRPGDGSGGTGAGRGAEKGATVWRQRGTDRRIRSLRKRARRIRVHEQDECRFDPDRARRSSGPRGSLWSRRYSPRDPWQFALQGQNRPGRPVGGSVPLRNGVHILHSEARFTWPTVERSEPLERIVLAYPGLERLDTLFSFHWGVAGWATGDRAGLLSTPFGTTGAWEPLGDTAIVVADGVSGTLTFVKPTKDSFRADTLDLGLAARPVSSRDLDRARAEDDAPRGAELFDVPEFWSVATSLIVGEDGEFWLRQAVEGDNEHWIVIAPDIGKKWRVVLPERFQLKDVWDGLLYGVARDELDVPTVGAMVNPVGASLIPEPA